MGAFPLSFVGLRLPPSELKKKVLEAAASGNLAHLEQFLASGADVNVRDEENDTPLIVGSRNGHAEIVRFLMARGADLEAANNFASYGPVGCVAGWSYGRGEASLGFGCQY